MEVLLIAPFILHADWWQARIARQREFDRSIAARGNLLVIIGEPDITLLTEKDDRLRMKLNGVDVFQPRSGEVVSDTSRTSAKPGNGRITVRVINHVGGEVMKVSRV